MRLAIASKWTWQGRTLLAFAVTLILVAAVGHIHPREEVSRGDELERPSGSTLSCSVCKFGRGVVVLPDPLWLAELLPAADVHPVAISQTSPTVFLEQSSRAPPISC